MSRSCRECNDGAVYDSCTDFCEICSASLVEAIIAIATTDGITGTPITIQSQNAVDTIADIFGQDFAMMRGVKPILSQDYLNQLGRISIDKRKVILQDISFAWGSSEASARILAVPATFSSLPNGVKVITAQMVLANPIHGGRMSPTPSDDVLHNATDLIGRFVVMDRGGGVSFLRKAQAAAAAGAAAVIICQIYRVWPFLMTSGDLNEDIDSAQDVVLDIPVVMISAPDGDDLKVALAAAVSRSDSFVTGHLYFGDDSQISECAICQDEISIGSIVLKLPCRHVFHADCVVSWLKSHDSCPLCRDTVS